MKIFTMYVAQPTLEEAVDYVESGLPIIGGYTKLLGLMSDQGVILDIAVATALGPRGGYLGQRWIYLINGEAGDIILEAQLTAIDPDGFVWDLLLLNWTLTGETYWVIANYYGMGVGVCSGVYTVPYPVPMRQQFEIPPQEEILVPSYSNCRWDFDYTSGQWTWVCDVTSVPAGTETPMPEPTSPHPVYPPGTPELMK